MKPYDIPMGAVVVGIDGSSHGDQALDWAVRHAAAESRDLVLLHAASATTAGQAILDSARRDVDAARFSGIVHTVLSGDESRAALLAASMRASVVVLGSRGRGLARSALLGSVGAAVAAQASCPVVVVRPHHPGKVRRGVLVGADGSAASLPVLEFAFRAAAEQDLPLTIVHVAADISGAASEPVDLAPDDSAYGRAALTLAESLAGLGERFPEVAVQRRLVRGTTAGALSTLADRMHLVVVGHERTRRSGRAPLGSVALSVLERAATVVAVVPEPPDSGLEAELHARLLPRGDWEVRAEDGDVTIKGPATASQRAYARATANIVPGVRHVTVQA